MSYYFIPVFSTGFIPLTKVFGISFSDSYVKQTNILTFVLHLLTEYLSSDYFNDSLLIQHSKFVQHCAEPATYVARGGRQLL